RSTRDVPTQARKIAGPFAVARSCTRLQDWRRAPAPSGNPLACARFGSAARAVLHPAAPSWPERCVVLPASGRERRPFPIADRATSYPSHPCRRGQNQVVGAAAPLVLRGVDNAIEIVIDRIEVSADPSRAPAV